MIQYCLQPWLYFCVLSVCKQFDPAYICCIILIPSPNKSGFPRSSNKGSCPIFSGSCNVNSNNIDNIFGCNFIITNNIFQKSNEHRTPCMHPRSKDWHNIDHVMVNIFITHESDNSFYLLETSTFLEKNSRDFKYARMIQPFATQIHR